MKFILYLISAAFLLSTAGCIIAPDRDHDDHWDHHGDHDWDHDHDHDDHH